MTILRSTGLAAAGAISLLINAGVLAQAPTPSSAQTTTPSGIRIDPSIVVPSQDAPAETLRLIGPNAPPTRVPVPTFSSGKPVIALASAIGGQLSVVLSKEVVGSNLDPYTRQSLPISGNTLDAVVLRGLDRVVARTMGDSERVFMRLNPVLLDGVAPPDRERVALARLVDEIRGWPQRQQWDKIVVVTPHYRGFERNGLGSKLHGVGLYVQNLDGTAEYDVVEPDGTPGAKRRDRYVALYYYAMMVVLDAKSLDILTSQAWLIDEKIHDSKSDALHVGNSIPVEVLAARIESFAEKASNTALTRTLSGNVEPGELRVVDPAGNRR